MIKTAVVILNWNGIDQLRTFLPEVYRCSNSKDCKVFLADNGSTDDSVEWTKSELPGVEIVRLDKNYGFSGGYNKAMPDIKAQYYVLLNSDIEVTENWLDPLITHLDNNPETAICQPKILDYKRRDYFEYAGAAGGFIDRYGFPFCRGRIQDIIERDSGQYNDEKEIFWASGACMIIRSKVWNELNGLDSDFFAHMEEIDMCWRAHSSGHSIFYVPDSIVYHVGGGTLNYGSPKKVFLNFRNNLYMLHKNLPGKNYRRIIFTRMLLDGIAGVRFIFLFKFNNCYQVFRAHIAYYRHKKSLNIKRKMLQSVSRPLKEGLILNKSVIIGFYIKGKKYFSGYTFNI